MLKIRQLHLIKENWAWNAKTPWCNYYWADNETPRHSYPAFCQRGHATTVCAKDLDVHVTCEACAAVEKDFPGIMTGLSGMVKDVRFDDDAASQLVLNLKRRAKFFDFSDETLLNVLDRLIKDRDEKQSATSKQEGRRKTLPFWRARDALLLPQREAARELDRKHGGSRLRALHDLEADKIEALGYPRPGKFERRAAFSTPGDKALEKANSRDRAGRRNNWPLGLNGEVFSIIPEKPFPAFKVEKNGKSREVSISQLPPNIQGFFLDPTNYKGRLKFTQLPMNADKLWRLTREKLAEANNLDALLKFTLEEFVNVCGLAGKDREAQLAAAKEAADALSCFRLVLEGWANLSFVDLCGFDPKTETFAIHLHAGFLHLTLAARPLLLFQSRALLALQECDRPAYFMGREMETHNSIDKNRLNGTADRLSVGKLLDTSGLPRLRELKTEARKWKERIKGRFEAELDKLLDTRKYPDRHPFLYNWEYLSPGGLSISPEEVEKLDYELWRKLRVRFEFFEPLPEREAARIERKREKLAAANAKREEARAVSSALPDGWAAFDFQRVASGLSRRKRVPKSAPVLEVEATSTATAEKPKPTPRPSTDPQTRIAELEEKLAAETDPATRNAIEATIENYRKRL